MSLLETKHLNCPYCGEPIDVVVDCTMEAQKMIEDCQVCCRPIEFEVVFDDAGEVALIAHTENDASY